MVLKQTTSSQEEHSAPAGTGTPIDGLRAARALRGLSGAAPSLSASPLFSLNLVGSSVMALAPLLLQLFGIWLRAFGVTCSACIWF